MERVKNWQELEPGMYYREGSGRVWKYVEPRNSELFTFIDEDSMYYDAETGEFKPYVETSYFTKNEVTHLYHTHVRG